MGGLAVRVLAAHGNLVDQRGTKGFAVAGFVSRPTGSMTLLVRSWWNAMYRGTDKVRGGREGRPEAAL